MVTTNLSFRPVLIQQTLRTLRLLEHAHSWWILFHLLFSVGSKFLFPVFILHWIYFLILSRPHFWHVLRLINLHQRETTCLLLIAIFPFQTLFQRRIAYMFDYATFKCSQCRRSRWIFFLILGGIRLYSWCEKLIGHKRSSSIESVWVIICDYCQIGLVDLICVIEPWIHEIWWFLLLHAKIGYCRRTMGCWAWFLSEIWGLIWQHKVIGSKITLSILQIQPKSALLSLHIGHRRSICRLRIELFGLHWKISLILLLDLLLCFIFTFNHLNQYHILR